MVKNVLTSKHMSTPSHSPFLALVGQQLASVFLLLVPPTLFLMHYQRHFSKTQILIRLINLFLPTFPHSYHPHPTPCHHHFLPGPLLQPPNFLSFPTDALPPQSAFHITKVILLKHVWASHFFALNPLMASQFIPRKIPSLYRSLHSPSQSGPHYLPDFTVNLIPNLLLSPLHSPCPPYNS